MKFIVFDSDYTYTRDNKPVIRLYGKSVDGNIEVNVVIHVFGFEPYIYVDNCDLDIVMLKELIEKELKGYIKRIEIVKRFRPMGYQFEKSDMLKLVMFNPRVVPEVRKLLIEKIEEVSDDKIYEADVLFRDRFLIDIGIDGMSIIEFNEVGKELKNYGIGCDKLYIVNIGEFYVRNEIVKIEY